MWLYWIPPPIPTTIQTKREPIHMPWLSENPHDLKPQRDFPLPGQIIISSKKRKRNQPHPQKQERAIQRSAYTHSLLNDKKPSLTSDTLLLPPPPPPSEKKP
jgi:hypothetical protein